MPKPKRNSPEHEQLQQTVQMFEVIAETQPNDIQSLEILKEAYLNLDRDQDAVNISKKNCPSLRPFGAIFFRYFGVRRYPPKVS